VPVAALPANSEWATVNLDGVEGVVCDLAVGPRTVWLVTADLKVYFRTGLTAEQPEGKAWTVVPPPTRSTSSWSVLAGSDAQIATNSLGRVWLLSPTGQTYFRKGANRDTPEGTGWTTVKGKPLRSISVANEVVCVKLTMRVRTPGTRLSHTRAHARTLMNTHDTYMNARTLVRTRAQSR
jgi:hypothetical protein